MLCQSKCAFVSFWIGCACQTPYSTAWDHTQTQTPIRRVSSRAGTKAAASQNNFRLGTSQHTPYTAASRRLLLSHSSALLLICLPKGNLWSPLLATAVWRAQAWKSACARRLLRAWSLYRKSLSGIHLYQKHRRRQHWLVWLELLPRWVGMTFADSAGIWDWVYRRQRR